MKFVRNWRSRWRSNEEESSSRRTRFVRSFSDRADWPIVGTTKTTITATSERARFTEPAFLFFHILLQAVLKNFFPALELRLSHLFHTQTGLAFRRYLLGQRLQRALAMLPNAKSLTDVAHQAGFADASHFSRTAHTILGCPPTLLRSHRWFIQQ